MSSRRRPGRRRSLWQIQSSFRSPKQARSSPSAKNAQEYCIAGRIEHCFEKIIVADRNAPGLTTLREASGSLLVRDEPQVMRNAQTLGSRNSKRFWRPWHEWHGKPHLIQRVAVPPAVPYVRFPETESVPEARLAKEPVTHLYVPEISRAVLMRTMFKMLFPRSGRLPRTRADWSSHPGLWTYDLADRWERFVPV